jgi:hypothetical protein
MALDRSNAVVTPALRVGAAAVGSFLAGPLGCATGAFLGGMLGDLFGQSAAALVETCAQKFGEAAAQQILGSQLDALSEKFRRQKQPQIKGVYREAFRESLIEVHIKVGKQFEGWFENWDACLKSSEPLDLDVIEAAQIIPANFQPTLSEVMRRLDRQGWARRENSLSLIAEDLRELPDDLLREIETRFPEHFKTQFRALIVREEYQQAWNEAELVFRDWLIFTISSIAERVEPIPKIAEDTAATRKEVAELSRGLAVLSQSLADERRMLGGTSGIRREDLLPIIAKEEGLRERLMEELRATDERISALQSLVGFGELEGGMR